MTDWLEIARRELPAADKKRLSSVSAVSEVGVFEKLQAFRLHRQTVGAAGFPFYEFNGAPYCC